MSLCPHGKIRLAVQDFHEVLLLSIFRNSAEKIQVLIKSDKDNRYLTWRPIYIFIKSLSVLLGMRNISWKVCRENKNTHFIFNSLIMINPLTSNDPYSGRTAPLTSKRCILYIYSTNIGTEYFKHCIYSPFFSLQNATCFIILTYLVPVLFTFSIQDVLKLKKIILRQKANTSINLV